MRDQPPEWPGCNAGSASLMAATVATMFAPGCRWMSSTTARLSVIPPRHPVVLDPRRSRSPPPRAHTGAPLRYAITRLPIGVWRHQLVVRPQREGSAAARRSRPSPRSRWHWRDRAADHPRGSAHRPPPAPGPIRTRTAGRKPPCTVTFPTPSIWLSFGCSRRIRRVADPLDCARLLDVSARLTGSGASAGFTFA